MAVTACKGCGCETETDDSVCPECSAVASAVTAVKSPTPGSLWTHRKTAHIYVVIGECQLEATNRPAVLYRQINHPDGGKLWARDRDEFLDGRFEWFESGEIA